MNGDLSEACEEIVKIIVEIVERMTSPLKERLEKAEARIVLLEQEYQVFHTGMQGMLDDVAERFQIPDYPHG